MSEELSIDQLRLILRDCESKVAAYENGGMTQQAEFWRGKQADFKARLESAERAVGTSN